MSARYFDYIEHNAYRYPDKCALHDIDSDRAFSYQTMHARVSRLAYRLRHDAKIKQGDRLAILAHNCPEYIELFFACGRIGVILVPLNWRLTVSELRFIIDDSEPELLIFGEEFSDQAKALQTLCPSLRALWSLDPDSDDYLGDLSQGALLDTPVPLTLDDIVIIMYTSGTTGRPKGALLTYGMSFWNAVNLGIPGMITPESVTLSVMPMFHTAGLNVYAIPTFHAGGTVLIMRGFDAGRILTAIDDPGLGITHFFHVPSGWQFLAQHMLFESCDLSRIVLAGVGGASAPLPLLETWQARGVFLQNGLGMTETGPAMTTLAKEHGIRKVGSVGTPLLHVEVRVMRADAKPAAADEDGEIWVRGPAVTPGYWRNQSANDSSFVDGWFRSGDIGRRDSEGFLYLLDRAKDMYISGGENVYPAEIESVLLEMPEITSAAVIGITDQRWGEVGRAIVTVSDGRPLDLAHVLKHCDGRLARFKCPRDVVVVDALPLNASGKIRKDELRRIYGREIEAARQ